MIDSTINSTGDWKVDLTWTILPAGRAWQRVVGNAFAAHGISLSLAAPVLVLAYKGDGLRQKAIAEAAGIDPAAVVRSLNELEQSGLLERKSDPSDRRANTLHLTKAGRDLANKLDQILTDLREQLFSAISAEEGNAVAKVLHLIERTGES
ncbi:MarR family transcriptional regulator [Pseudomonas monteilii]|uniref:MarR family transcriptional regulator n=1 Tax=Pseudomonas monteilii TaxID=76759 RepID=A0AAE6RD32_9PSED|nr:MarR family transcriptional regulator [Pseudomonas monteilii]QHB28796.1 MarR family transcriptional regulator [Pseudomonas monteilii]